MKMELACWMCISLKQIVGMNGMKNDHKFDGLKLDKIQNCFLAISHKLETLRVFFAGGKLTHILDK